MGMQVALKTLQPRTTLRVERTGAGKILGASIASKGPATGHGFELDDTSLDQIAALASKASPAAWWTHGDGQDGLGLHLGRWSNVRREGDRVAGDFAFSPAAKHVRPVGLSVDAPTYLMDMADQDPEAFGVSPFITYSVEQAGAKRLARVQDVTRADFVGYPAANHSGLLSARPDKEGAVDLEVLTKKTAELSAQVADREAKLAAAEKARVDEVASLKAQVATHEKTNAELTAALSTFKAERAALQAKALDDVVADVERKCLAAGATPPAKAERDDIRAALDAHEPTGRKLAAAVLERCLARVSGGGTKPLDPHKAESDASRSKFIDGLVKRATLDRKEN